jgi:hypothetical protein
MFSNLGRAASGVDLTFNFGQFFMDHIADIPDDGLLTFAECKLDLEKTRWMYFSWVKGMGASADYWHPILIELDKSVLMLSEAITKIDQLDMRSDDLLRLKPNLTEANTLRNFLVKGFNDFDAKNGKMLEHMVAHSKKPVAVDSSPEPAHKKPRSADDATDDLLGEHFKPVKNSPDAVAAAELEEALACEAATCPRMSSSSNLFPTDHEEDPTMSRFCDEGSQRD